MRYSFLFFSSALFILSCGQKEPASQKESVTKEKDTVVAVAPAADTSATKSAADSKTMTLVLKGYEEGDNMYLLFTDAATGKDYSFVNPDERNFNGVKIFVPDANAQFEVKANSKLIGKKFIVKSSNKLTAVNGATPDGSETKAWVIDDLKPAE